MTLEQIEQTYKDFINDLKNGNKWEVTYSFIFDILSFYNIKIPKALSKCEVIRSDDTIKGTLTTVKQMDSIYKAIDKLKLVNV